MNLSSPLDVKLSDGNSIQVWRIDNNYFGNPRFLVHYLSLGLKEYETTELTRRLGLRKYRGRDFGGGYAITAHNIKDKINWIYETIKEEQK